MRVLFVNRMASLERGGGETFDLEISRHLEQLGCEVSYLSGLPLFSGARTPIPHPRAFTVRTPNFTWVPWDVMKGGWRIRVADVAMFESAAVRWAERRASQFDIIQVCELPGFVHRWKARKNKVPVVIRLTAPNHYDPSNAVPKADAVIASGTSMEKLKNGPLPQVINVPNGVDTGMFHPHASDFRKAHGISPDALVFLYVARFQAFKNHRVLLDAFSSAHAQIPAARLVLVGSGPLRERAEQKAHELGIAESVLFLGEVAFKDLPDVYAAADIKVISSDYESFCFAAIEAMASGLPIVSTDCGWVPRLLAGGQGGDVVPVNNAPALADAMIRLGADPERRRAIGAFNRAKAVREHGWISSAGILLDVYKSLLRRTS